MKVIGKDLASDWSGTCKLLPETPEDLWHVYNLLSPGDRVTATSLRKVQRDDGGGGGGDSERVKVKLTLEVESVDYDGADGGVLRVRGRNLSESEWVRLGAYHTLNLEPQRAFTAHEALWDPLHLERIDSASNPAATSDLAAVVLQEGLAHVCLIGGQQTSLRQKVEVALPKKRGAAASASASSSGGGFDKAQAKFFEAVLQAVLRHVDFGVVRCLVLAGPGFTKDELLKYMMAEAQRRDLRPLLENRERILTAYASSGYKHALPEVLATPAVAAAIRDIKALAEVKALDQFLAMLSDDPARAFHGPGHVLAADEAHAVQTLLLSDSLFRCAKPEARMQWAALVESVKAKGGKVHVFSAAHTSGEQLDQLTGEAAVLRFPLPALLDEEIPPPPWFAS